MVNYVSGDSCNHDQCTKRTDDSKRISIANEKLEDRLDSL